MRKNKLLYIRELKDRQINSNLKNIPIDKDIVNYWEEILDKDNASKLKELLGYDLEQFLSFEQYNDNLESEIVVDFNANLNDLKRIQIENKINLSEGTLIFDRFYNFFLNLGLKKLTIEMSPIVVNAYSKHLLLQMGRLALGTLMFEMHILKESHELKGSNPKEEYQYFNDYFLGNISYIENILEIYPILGRLLFELIENSSANFNIFWERFDKDKSLINEKICNKRDTISITEVTTGISDSHKNGETVFIITLNNTHKIAYKPHSLKSQLLYHSFVEDISIECKHHLKTYSILDKTTYGWEEVVDYKECDSLESVKRYYYRFGVLLAVNYMLSTTDLHVENLIVSGEFPFIIDTETILNNVRLQSCQTGTESVYKILNTSILSIGLLPHRKFSKNGNGINMGAINAKEGSVYPVLCPAIVEKDTSEMHFEYTFPISTENQNLVKYNGETEDASKYVDHVVEGFTDAYTVIMENKSLIYKHAKKFSNLNIRYLVQDTQRYSLLLHASYHPDFLQKGIDRELMLYNILKDLDSSQADIDVAKSEISDLLDMDIPYFHANTSEKCLYNSKNEKISNYFDKTSIELFKEKLKKLSKKNLQEQVMYLKLSLTDINEYIQDKQAVKNYADLTRCGIDNSEAKKLYTECAFKIADIIASKAVYNDDATDTNWLGVFIEGPEEESYCSIKPLGSYLYEGTAGVAIFLNAINQHSNGKYQKICECLKKNIFRYTDDMLERKNSFENDGSGIFSGESCVIYAYQLLYTITKDDDYLNYADKHLTILRKTINFDTHYDVVYGNAGALLSVLNMFEITQDEQYLNEASDIGDMLLTHQLNNGGWKSESMSSALTGFSHGASGISYSLIKLWNKTKTPKYLNAALKGFDFERSMFDLEYKNWKDQRLHLGEKISDRNIFMTAWCHGASGILLSRAKGFGMLGNHMTASLSDDIKYALESTLNSGFNNNDCLCHGNVGNAEILCEVACILNDSKLLSTSQQIFYEVIKQLEKGNFDSGRTYFHGHQTIGLMTGLSGIGYSLLRQIDKTLPCILSVDI